jgi:hypothetical protein
MELELMACPMAALTIMTRNACHEGGAVCDFVRGPVEGMTRA